MVHGWREKRTGVGEGMSSPGLRHSPRPALFDVHGKLKHLLAPLSLPQAKVRTLFYDVQTKVLWWSDPGAAARGTARHRPSSLLSLRKEQPLPVATLLEVREGSVHVRAFLLDGATTMPAARIIGENLGSTHWYRDA